MKAAPFALAVTAVAALLSCTVLFASSDRVVASSQPTALAAAPLRVHDVHRGRNDPFAVRDELTERLSELPSADQRRLLAMLACQHAVAGDIVLMSACMGSTPSIAIVKKVADAFRPRSALAPPPSVTSSIVDDDNDESSDVDTIVNRTAPRWLDSMRPMPGEWATAGLMLQPWELEPILTPNSDTIRARLPSCVWRSLAILCEAKYWHPAMRRYNISKGGGVWSATWDKRGLECLVSNRTAAGEGAGAQVVVEIGGLKPTSTELENTILMSDGCDSATSVTDPMPEPGNASLPLDALLGAADSVRSGGTLPGNAVLGGEEKLVSLRAKLARGHHVRILAIGASNTAMFAPACVNDGCEVAAHEQMAKVTRRFKRRAAKGALGPGQPDWFVRLLLTLHHRYPSAPLLGVAQAYGGLDPKSVASCLVDFLESAAPWQSLSPGCTKACDASPDLLVLDFAIFAGKKPTLSYLRSLERLLRYLHHKDTAVVFLNMANWCRGRDGHVAWEVMGHAKCQRFLFDEHRSRHNLGVAELPDAWHSMLSKLAAHYGHPSVSMFHALQPLVVSGRLRASDFTQDGMHPIYWPKGTDLGNVYVSYIADALAFAIDPSAVTHHDNLWNGRATLTGSARHMADAIGGGDGGSKKRRPLAEVYGAWRRIASAAAVNGGGAFALAGGNNSLPQPMTKGVDSLRGVRCYGWAGRSVQKKKSNRGAWQKCVVNGVSWSGNFGTNGAWASTNVEVAYNGSAWVPLAKRSKKPGLTSISVGDNFQVAVDTSLTEDSNRTTEETVAILQLTYLKSYEQTGIFQVTCHKGCSCDPVVVDTLDQKWRFATLATSLSGPVSKSPRCVLKIVNVSPPPVGAESRTKVKLVSIAVLASKEKKITCKGPFGTCIY